MSPPGDPLVAKNSEIAPEQVEQRLRHGERPEHDDVDAALEQLPARHPPDATARAGGLTR
jgi:hypothetical protein